METRDFIKQFEESLGDVNYLYYNQFHGALAICMRESKISWSKLSDEIIEDFKYAICNLFHDGCEPEFEDEDSWLKWENFNMGAYRLTTESKLIELHKKKYSNMRYNYNKFNLSKVFQSPFNDKTLSYHILIDPTYGNACELFKGVMI